MAGTTITMLNIRTILQTKLRGLSDRKTAHRAGISRNTLKTYLERLQAVNTDFGELLKLSDAELSEIAFCPADTQIPPDGRKAALLVHLDLVLPQLGKNGVTRYLLWQEYLLKHPAGYGYTQFCEHFSLLLMRSHLTMHFEHKAGEQMMVDFAGDRLRYIDKETGEVVYCETLVCVLPHSGFTFVMALASQKQEDFCYGIVQALAFLGGVPRSLLFDNFKSAVIRSDRYEPKINELLEQLAVHYGTTIMATRPGKPKDKATVENAVLNAYRRIYAPLRHREFFSLSELNKAVWEQLEVHNAKHFQNKPYSRQDVFLEREQALLGPLPSVAFEVIRVVSAKVQMNYHVLLGQDKHFYSVPFAYVGKTAVVHYSSTTVEVYIDHRRVAFHQRNRKPHQYSTVESHMPEAHRRYNDSQGWDKEYFLQKARAIGPCTESAVQRCLDSRTFIQQSYNTCKGILRLATQHGPERLEAACKMAQPAPTITYRFLDNILRNRTDLINHQHAEQPTLFSDHENLRGAAHYQ
jgi:transposase